MYPLQVHNRNDIYRSLILSLLEYGHFLTQCPPTIVIPKQIGPPVIVVVPICSGLGATNFNFWVLRSSITLQTGNFLDTFLRKRWTDRSWNGFFPMNPPHENCCGNCQPILSAILLKCTGYRYGPDMIHILPKRYGQVPQDYGTDPLMSDIYTISLYLKLFIFGYLRKLRLEGYNV